MENLLIVHAFSTFFMTGLCWFVQIVHYPLFHQISLIDFPKYERKNSVTAYVTVPVMIIELSTGLYLLFLNQDYLFFSNVILMGIIGLSTIIYQVPIHLKLMSRATPQLINRLINTNWIRTITWSIKSVITVVILNQLLNGTLHNTV